MQRFLVEIKTTANLTRPQILPLHDSGEADGFLFYVMLHIGGEDDEWTVTDLPMPPPRVFVEDVVICQRSPFWTCYAFT